MNNNRGRELVSTNPQSSGSNNGCHHCHGRGHVVSCHPHYTLIIEQEHKDSQEGEASDQVYEPP